MIRSSQPGRLLFAAAIALQDLLHAVVASVPAAGPPWPATGPIWTIVLGVRPAAPGFLTLYPAGVRRPATTAVSFSAGQVRANSAILHLSGTPPGLAVFNGATGGTTDVILDVTGYFR